MSVHDILPGQSEAAPGEAGAPRRALPAAAPAGRGVYAVRRRWTPRAALVLAGGAAVLFVAALAGAWIGGFTYRPLAEVLLAAPPDRLPLAAPRAERSASPAKLSGRIAAQAPAGIYVVVDTIANRLYLKRGDEVLREAVCSTGTGGLLVDPASGRRWVFDTPLGVRRVQEKKKDPVWVKPDWAFVEEGLPLPEDPAERYDPNSLGDYALSLGDGYLIHGTLYQRLLGRSVTHGCVRLGDEDLEAVYRAVPVGARVYIY